MMSSLGFKWVALFLLGVYIHITHSPRFISGATPADLFAASFISDVCLLPNRSFTPTILWISMGDCIVDYNFDIEWIGLQAKFYVVGCIIHYITILTITTRMLFSIVSLLFVWFVWLLSYWLVTQAKFNIMSHLVLIIEKHLSGFPEKQLKSQVNQSNFKNHMSHPL